MQPIPNETLEYQPDAVEIEHRPVPDRVRWVLYIILVTVVAAIVGAIIFQVDRIVVAEGSLITTEPTITIQPLNTAVIRSIEVQVGDRVAKGQILANLDPTFASADLSQLSRRRLTLATQMRRIEAELSSSQFLAAPDEGDDGVLQEQIFRQRKQIFTRNRQLNDEKIATLQARKTLNEVQKRGLTQQLNVLRDMEGTVGRLPQGSDEYRIRLLEAQKNRKLAASDIERLQAEQQVISHELQQAESEWNRFVDERIGELLEKEVQIKSEFDKISEEINKAKRLHDLVRMRAPQDSIVLRLAERSVGAIIQQAEPLITLVPLNSRIEVEVQVQPKDIGRIRKGDNVRIKLDAFPFQKHDTLPGEVRVISEDAFITANSSPLSVARGDESSMASYYSARVRLLSTMLKNVPEGFRLMPGMRVQAEIKVGTRSVISYFLYPVIRALDEGLREP